MHAFILTHTLPPPQTHTSSSSLFRPSPDTLNLSEERYIPSEYIARSEWGGLPLAKKATSHYIETKLQSEVSVAEASLGGLTSIVLRCSPILSSKENDRKTGGMAVGTINRLLGPSGGRNAVVRALKIKADDDVVGIVFREYDYDSSGSIEYTEVCRVALRDALKRSWMRVMDLFKKWDRDNSQSVSKFEFRKAIKECGFDAPANEVDKLFDSMDSDGSGQIDFKELNMNMRQGSQIRLAEELQVGAAGEIEVDAKNASAVREAGSREKRIETWQESLKSGAQQ